jgi:hypothetical protein
MRALVLALITASLSVATTAVADPTSTSERDAARAVALRGAGYYDSGEWEQAREHFHRAYEMVRAPTLALMEARALVKLGHLLEAREAYARAMQIAGDETSEPFRRAAADARIENANLERRVPTMQLVLRNGDSPSEVSLDGQRLAKSVLRGPIAANPGTHVIAVIRPGQGEVWETVALEEGEHRSLQLEPPPGSAERSAERQTLRPFMWTAFAAGGAGLLVGVIGSALASDLRSRPDELDGYRDYKTASTIGYVAGAVGLASGGVLWALEPRGTRGATQVGMLFSPMRSAVVVSRTF